MKHITKRLLSLLLCLVLCISWLPAAALAEEEPEAPVAEAAAEEAPEEATEELTEEASEAAESAAEPAEPADPEPAEPEVPAEPELSEELVEASILETPAPADDTDLLADAAWIPDESFRNAIKAKLGVSTLTPAEAAAVTTLDVKASGISSLTGIAYFTGLTELKCSNNSLTSLDISANTALNILFCENNSLTSLKLPASSRYVYLYNNKLASLDVSSCAKLNTLSVTQNNLTSLDVSGCPELRNLECRYNSLTSLDVTRCTKLDYLYVGTNSLTKLDISKCTELSELDTSKNKLGTLDLSKCTKLYYLDCAENGLKNLDLSPCPDLEYLYCGNNSLTKLDVSMCPKLLELSCMNNSLTSLDVTKNTSLTELRCASNKLTSLDITKNTSLEWLICYSNGLTSLDVTENTSLTTLECYSNSLTSLDVTNNTALTKLSCYSNKLTSLDVTQNTSLNTLNCSYNCLTQLKLPADSAITDYKYSNQQITLPVEVLNTVFIGDLTAAFENPSEAAFTPPGSGDQLMVTETGLLVVAGDADEFDAAGCYNIAYQSGVITGNIVCTPSETHSAPALQQSYLLLAPEESAKLLPAFTGLAAKLQDAVTVFVPIVDNLFGAGGVVNLIGNEVIAVYPGVALLQCEFYLGEIYLGTANCRVDVTAGGSADVRAVSLVDTAVTTNIYSTSYARIGILPELDMLSAALSGEGEAATAVRVESAKFIDTKTAAAFTLRVIDDRTLELVPKAEAVAAGIKGTFKSQIAVKLKDRGDALVTSAKLKLTVTNTKPTVKAAALSLNSFLQLDYPITLTGAAVESVAVASAPDWLYVDTINRTVTLTNAAPAKASGKLVLNCTLAEYAMTVPVTIKVSAARTEPKVKLSQSTVTLTAGGSTAEVIGKVITPGMEDRLITVSRITEGSGKSLTEYKSGKSCPYLRAIMDEIEGVNQWFLLQTGIDDGKNHTFKVYLKVAGAEVAVMTVKVNTAKSITLSAKAAGTMDSTVNNSACTVAVTTKGLSGTWKQWLYWNSEAGVWDYTPNLTLVPLNEYLPESQHGCFAVARIEGIYTKSGEEYAAYAGNGFQYKEDTYITHAAENISIFRNTAEALPKNTYYAKVALYTWNAETNAFARYSTTYVKLNISFPATPTAGKLKVKATAKDYYLTGVIAQTTATVTGLADYRELELTAVKTYDAVTGKLTEPVDVTVTDLEWFYYYDGQIKLTSEGRKNVKPGDKYTFTLTCVESYKTPSLDATGNPVSGSFSITLKGGKVKATTTGTPVLLKKDRFDTTTVAFSVTGGTLNRNNAPELDAKSAALYTVDWALNEYNEIIGITLKWKDNTVASTAASGTVKVSYWVEGNNNMNKPDTLSLKLTVK